MLTVDKTSNSSMWREKDKWEKNKSNRTYSVTFLLFWELLETFRCENRYRHPKNVNEDRSQTERSPWLLFVVSFPFIKGVCFTKNGHFTSGVTCWSLSFWTWAFMKILIGN